ncbi:DEP domain-containing protein 1B-like isoform X3 [Dreissena polymorpha]|uniref:DEP domain-containing protein 1B-like isoform X3 n=1 Tax=Dreissena polymorpha TaxID=45954 RepID=UPI00226437AF|nr:DEP domain-containing protein 1B-like isoform X3 [Dreissena polymorpha]
MGEHITAGPYRATLLWNSLIRSFRNGIELGRHRRYMKTYDECFVASDAVEWMHQYLTENPNFGTDVSRAQAVQLLKKLHKSRLFEDVRGPKHNRGEFTDSSRLFRLTLASPSKSIRTPIALRNNLKLANLRRHTEEKTSHAEPVKLDFDRMSSLPSLHDNKTTLPECHFVTKPLTAQEIEEQWKLLTFESLEKILGVQGLDDIIEPRYVSGRNIMHNCLYINKSGVVTNIDPKDQLPHWALSAMKCLAYWPDKTDENLPNYPGFEKDVFRVVKDYFCGLKEPLMTYNMYEVITNVFVKATNHGKSHPGVEPYFKGSSSAYPTNNEYFNSTPKTLISFKSVENLLMTLTRRYKPLTECQDASEGYSSATNILDLSPIHPVHENSRTSPNGDGLPLTRFETAFGPDNQTVTRVFYGDGIATDYNHEDSRNQSHHTPVETHFESDISPSSTGSSFFRKTSLRHSMHNLFNRGPSIRDRKSKKDKNSARRCSTGYGLNDDSSYGCTVGVYSRSSSDSSSYDTPVSRLPAVNRTESCTAGYVDRSEKYRSKPPIHNRPPSFDALYPESKYPKTHEPVIDASKRPSFFKRKKSLSTASLHAPHRKSVVERPDPGIKNLSSVSDGSSKGGPGGKEVGNGRSLSLSDLVGAAPPIENELQKQCQGRIRESDDSLTMDDCTERIVKALQLVCLLLPPANRRRLHLLLRLINKMATNDKLVLDKTQPLRLFLLETFSRAVLCCHDEGEMDDQLVIQLVAFLMDHYVDVFAVPIDLKTGVEARITKLQRTKIRYASEDPATLHYCQKVSLDEYENQRLTASQQALATLLEEIIQDNSMSSKEKKKRLKQFQKMHPDIYLRRFPCSLSEPDLYPSQPRIKPPLLAKPLLKLKGLRL